MTNREKLEVLKAFLNENSIPFKENVMWKGQKFDLYIGKYHICVRLSDENDQKFYERVKRIYHPLFIRESETSDFVLEKMQNLIIDLMKCQHKFISKKHGNDNHSQRKQ